MGDAAKGSVVELYPAPSRPHGPVLEAAAEEHVKDERIAQLEAQLQELDEEIRALKLSNRTHYTAARSLRAQASGDTAAVIKLSRRLALTESEKERLQESVRSMEKSADTSRQVIQMQNDEIASLNMRIADLEGRIVEAYRTIQQQSVTIIDLEARLAERKLR